MLPFRASPTRISLTHHEVLPAGQLRITQHDCPSPLCNKRSLKQTLRITLDRKANVGFVVCRGGCKGKYDMFITSDSTAEKVLYWYTEWYMRVYDLRDVLKDDKLLM